MRTIYSFFDSRKPEAFVSLGIGSLLAATVLALAARQVLPQGVNALAYTLVGGGAILVGAGAKNFFERRRSQEQREKAAITLQALARRRKACLQRQRALEAAKVLQAATRLLLTKREVTLRKAAVLTVQRAFRSSLAKRERALLQEAVLTIQHAMRSLDAKEKAAKRRQVVLPYPLYLSAEPYYRDYDKLAGLSNPTFGKSRDSIFLPREVPVVVRWGEDVDVRYPKMLAARQICLEHHFTHLEIARATLCRPMLIEERFPAEHPNPIEGMWYYFTRKEQFSQAISECTTFLCHARLCDLVGGNRSWRNELVPGAKDLRFDNLLLYFSQGNYKIALVDLETFEMRSKISFSRAARTAAQLFPYHVDTILKTIAALKPKNFSPKQIASLEADAEASRKLYELLVEKNLCFYKEHNITPKAPRPVQITEERECAIIARLSRDLDEHKGFMLGPTHPKERFEKELAPFIIEIAKANFSAFDSSPKSSYGALIRARCYVGQFTLDLREAIENFCEENGIDFVRCGQLSLLPHYLLQELVRGGELAFYGNIDSDFRDAIFY